MKKIYIACAMTRGTPGSADPIRAMADSLRKRRCQVTEPSFALFPPIRYPARLLGEQPT